MKNSDIKEVQTELSILIGQPLRKFGRAGTLLTMNFGELVEIDAPARDKDGRLARDENGQGIHTKGFVGRHAFNAYCEFRVICGNKILFGRSDFFLPNTTLIPELYQDEDFDLDDFEWHKKGDNYFDEMIARFFSRNLDDYIVKKIIVSPFGDLEIVFENGFEIHLFVDDSTASESWCFYEIGGECENSLKILGTGVERE
ncbi:MAG: hypothetical protein FWG65_08850 [Turicibacter sp.]|nr:hypothetical protein [Turicibacter sp.]